MSPPDVPPESDPLAAFRTWRGFLFVAIVVNVLFIYGMAGAMANVAAAGWVKAMSWLPFNVIASVLYYVFLKKLGGGLYGALCVAMILLNWAAYFAV